MRVKSLGMAPGNDKASKCRAVARGGGGGGGGEGLGAGGID